MLEVDKKREATASIRGYFYQLDAALLEVLSAGIDDQVVIEGVEDFDRYTPDGVTYNQVKYYEAQSLTDSVLREPLQKLFVHFHGLSAGDRAGRRYVLYGHYKEIKIDTGKLTVERFKEVMTYFKVEQDKSRTKKSHLDGLGEIDGVIEAFCAIFEIRLAKEFVEQRSQVIAKLRSDQRVSELEAAGFHYPRSFEYVAGLAINKDHLERTTTLRNLREHLKGTQAIHQSWMLREKDAATYARYMRELYFSDQNTAGVARAFVLEVGDDTDAGAVCDQLHEIARKWSSADNRRLPNSDRHAPYVLLRGANEKLRSAVKDELYETGIDFVDGHPYLGSPFRRDHIRTAQTLERPIALRLVDDPEQLSEALDGLGRKRCRIFEFFTTAPTEITVPGGNFRMFSIPVDDVSFVKRII